MSTFAHEYYHALTWYDWDHSDTLAHYWNEHNAFDFGSDFAVDYNARDSFYTSTWPGYTNIEQHAFTFFHYNESIGITDAE